MKDTDGAAPFDGKAFSRTLTARPGVYRMLDASGVPIYVGKARSLKKRVSAYFNASRRLDAKVDSMVSQIRGIEVTATNTENEALLLESHLIKELKPRYNIVLRDDKSYPYIYLTPGPFSRLNFHRGARSGKGRYFGPFPSAGAVRQTLSLTQKLFQIRQCEDSYFRNRARPCLQHQIGRCTAPCVGLIEETTYRADVEHAVMFLEGRSQEVIDALVERMESAAERLDFEGAARIRDQIASLKRVQQRQYVSTEGGDADVVACCVESGIACVQVFYIRGGHNLGNKAFFPEHAGESDAAEVLAAFVPQYYLANRSDRIIPRQIVLSHALEDGDLLGEVLSARAGHAVNLTHALRGERARWVELALDNCRLALQQRIADRSGYARRLAALEEALGIEEPIERIECFDISHTRGEATVASCVVFGTQGPIKSEYRRFNIENIAPGDDYAAMHQVLTRRYTRVRREDGRLPDVLLIDGGRGQIEEARAVLEELQIEDVVVVGVAKGPSRRPGFETLVVSAGETAPRLDPTSPALHLIQQVRDEAHRFAITGHRNRRSRVRTESPLESIPGIGAKRRRALLQHFGGLQGVTRAGIDDLSRVPGIDRSLAQKIYDLFHA